MDSERCGCFAWCVSFKKSVNERWARFRNRLRRRFYARRGQTVDPASVVNETGTDDLIISKKPYKSDKAALYDMAPRTTVQGVPVEGVETTDRDTFDILGGPVPALFVLFKQALEDQQRSRLTDNIIIYQTVQEYVSGIIHKAADVLRSENYTVFNEPKVIMVQSADDNVSISSSVLSQMADTIVTESLTNIVLDSDTNQSSQNGHRPRTITEFKEMFELAETTMEDGLSPLTD